MKVLLLNRDERSHEGGDSLQLRAYQKALHSFGHQAEYDWALHPEVRGYDQAWLFHINFGWTSRQWNKLQQWSIPYKVIALFYPGLYSDIHPDTARAILTGAKIVYCLSRAEEAELLVEFPATKTHVINNGVDKEIFSLDGEKIEGDYLLSVGRFDESKGHGNVIKAAKAMGLDVYVIGSAWDTQFREKLQPLYDRIHFIDMTPQVELAKYYRGAKCYVCGSRSERNSLTVLEAAACGAPLVNSIHNRGKEWLDAPAVEPENTEELVEAIRSEIELKKNRSDQVPTWESIVEEILKT